MAIDLRPPQGTGHRPFTAHVDAASCHVGLAEKWGWPRAGLRKLRGNRFCRNIIAGCKGTILHRWTSWTDRVVAQSDDNLFFDSPDAQPYLDSRRWLGFSRPIRWLPTRCWRTRRGAISSSGPVRPPCNWGSSRSTSAGSARRRRRVLEIDFRPAKGTGYRPSVGGNGIGRMTRTSGRVKDPRPL